MGVSRMTTRSQLIFSDNRLEALSALESIGSGRGWCNVVPVTVEDIPDLRVNVLGLWLNSGVPVASYVTTAPRNGEPQPSSLGLLHSHRRLGRERISLLLGGAPFVVRQDLNQRGLLFDVPEGTAPTLVLDRMCSMSDELCDYDKTGDWRLDLFVR
ncbi:MAG: hypothetical protein JWM55_967 [Acidimicrobiaceae bacterium]|nr:hypothetical protein [Acidimicrobiaceae bacterium]